MIPVYYSKKGTPYVHASDLHRMLEIETPLRKWFPRMIEYGFSENQDFSQVDKKVHLEQGGYTLQKDWFVTVEMAKNIAMIQRSPKGKAIREYLLGLDKKVEEGMLLTHAQVAALFDICKVMGFFSVQVFFETEHFNNAFQGKHNRWWDARARLFGYTAADLKEMMQAIGKKYINQRQAIRNIDKYELIKIGVYDMFLAMGKSQQFAINVSQFAKSIAEEIKPEIYDDRNMSIEFKSPEQLDIIEDIKSYKTSSTLIEEVLDQRVRGAGRFVRKSKKESTQLGMDIDTPKPES